MKRSSKKFTKKISNDGYMLLSAIRYGGSSPKLLAIELGIPKQNLNYKLKKLVKEGVITKPSKGNYFLTDSGKRLYDQYERYKNKQLVRVENLKVTFVVETGGEELVKQLKSKKHELKNGVTIYHTNLKNHSTRLIVSNDEYNFEVTVTNSLGITPNEAFHHAMLEAYGVVNYLTSWFDVELSEGYANGKPEIAIPSPIASSLLQTSGASQIRTDKAIMNRSKGRGADWEVYDLQEAQKVVDMPNAITRLEDKSNRNDEKLDKILSLLAPNSYSDLAGSSTGGFI